MQLTQGYTNAYSSATADHDSKSSERHERAHGSIVESTQDATIVRDRFLLLVRLRPGISQRPPIHVRVVHHNVLPDWTQRAVNWVVQRPFDLNVLLASLEHVSAGHGHGHVLFVALNAISFRPPLSQ